MYKKSISMILVLIMILSLLTPLSTVTPFAESVEKSVTSKVNQAEDEESKDVTDDIPQYDETPTDYVSDPVVAEEPIEPRQEDEAPTINYATPEHKNTSSDLSAKIPELAGTGSDSDIAQTGIILRDQALEWLRDKADNNIALDYDNSPPGQIYQCADLAAGYLYFLGADEVVGGDAKDYCNKDGSLPSGWNSISNYAGFEPHPGDICVWGSYVAPANSDAGHIGVVYAVNGDTITTVEQNDMGRHYCAWCTRPASGVTTYIRPAFDLEPPHIGRVVSVAFSNSQSSGSSGGGHSSVGYLNVTFSDIEDNVGVTETYVKVREFGQTWDQAKTYSAALDGSTANARVYKGSGAIYIECYAKDESGNWASVGTKDTLIDLYPIQEAVGTYEVTADTAPVRCAPYEQINGANTTINQPQKKGDRLSIVGYHTNDKGNLWYKMENGYWIYSGNVKKCFVSSAWDFILSLFGKEDKFVYYQGQVIAAESGLSGTSAQQDAELAATGAETNAAATGIDEYLTLTAYSPESYSVGGNNGTYSTIFFDPRGGGMSCDKMTVRSGDACGNLPTPVRYGYTFDGWYTSADGDNQITGESVVTSSLTVYAHWTRTILIQGKCGDDANYILYLDRDFDIMGSGKMSNPKVVSSRYKLDSIPWYKYKPLIYHVNVLEGITYIGAYSFSNCNMLQSVTIADTVTTIGEGAFTGCPNLNNVKLPDSLTQIGFAAFETCTSLSSIDLPDSIKYIDGQAFCNCTSLSSIDLPDSLNEISGFSFYNCTSLSDIDLPDSIKYIGRYAFVGCRSLKNVTIPSSTERVEEYAFSHCTSLSEVVFPNSSHEIGYRAFANCTSLIKVVLPEELETIYSEAFNGCASLTSVNIPNNVNVSKGGSSVSLPDVAIGFTVNRSSLYGPFSNCPSLKTITFDPGITRICPYLFEDCDGLEEIEIPDTVTEIGRDAFANCINLRQVALSRSLTTISGAMFYGCKSLNKISIPNSVTTIDGSAFAGCSSLEEVDIPRSVDEIWGGAFANCTSLKKIMMLRLNVRFVKDDVFSGSDQLTIYGYANSSVEEYADKNNIPFVDILIPAEEIKLSEKYDKYYNAQDDTYYFVLDQGESLDIEYEFDPPDSNDFISYVSGELTRELTDKGYSLKFNGDKPTGVYDCYVKTHGGLNSKKIKVFVSDKTITEVDDTWDVTISSRYEESVTRFMPQKDMIIEFTSESDLDTLGRIFDTMGNSLSFDRNYGDDEDFSLFCKVKAGETYLLVSGLYGSGTGIFRVSLKEVILDAEDIHIGEEKKAEALFYNQECFFRYTPEKDTYAEFYVEDEQNDITLAVYDSNSNSLDTVSYEKYDYAHGLSFNAEAGKTYLLGATYGDDAAGVFHVELRQGTPRIHIGEALTGKRLSADDGIVKFKFVPEQDCTIRYRSVGSDEGRSVWGWITDEDESPLTSDNWDGWDFDFDLEYTVEAGTTYYLYTDFVDFEILYGSINVSLTFAPETLQEGSNALTHQNGTGTATYRYIPEDDCYYILSIPDMDGIESADIIYDGEHYDLNQPIYSDYSYNKEIEVTLTFSDPDSELDFAMNILRARSIPVGKNEITRSNASGTEVYYVYAAPGYYSVNIPDMTGIESIEIWHNDKKHMPNEAIDNYSDYDTIFIEVNFADSEQDIDYEIDVDEYHFTALKMGHNKVESDSAKGTAVYEFVSHDIGYVTFSIPNDDGIKSVTITPRMNNYDPGWSTDIPIPVNAEELYYATVEFEDDAQISSLDINVEKYRYPQIGLGNNQVSIEAGVTEAQFEFVPDHAGKYCLYIPEMSGIDSGFLSLLQYSSSDGASLSNEYPVMLSETNGVKDKCYVVVRRTDGSKPLNFNILVEEKHDPILKLNKAQVIPVEEGKYSYQYEFRSDKAMLVNYSLETNGELEFAISENGKDFVRYDPLRMSVTKTILIKPGAVYYFRLSDLYPRDNNNTSLTLTQIDQVDTVTCEDSLNITINQGVAVYQFTPKVDGFYRPELSCDNNDIYVEVLDSDMSVIDSVSESVYSLSAKKTYYIVVTGNKLSGNNSANLQLQYLETYSALGDVDGDGEVTIMDATFIQRWLADLSLTFTLNEQAADVDANGTIEVTDATFIQRFVDQIETPYQVGKAI